MLSWSAILGRMDEGDVLRVGWVDVVRVLWNYRLRESSLSVSGPLTRCWNQREAERRVKRNLRTETQSRRSKEEAK